MSKYPFSGILTISGPSGVGKTTLVAGLLRMIPSSEPLVRVTTRGKRRSDNRREYIYLSDEEFQSWDEQGKLLFPNANHGFQHAMLREQVVQLLTTDVGGFVVGDVSYTGAENLMLYAQQQGKGELISSVFLDMQGDETELHRRMSKRGDCIDVIAGRIKDCESWAEAARKSTNVKFRFIDALKSKQMVLAEVLSTLY